MNKIKLHDAVLQNNIKLVENLLTNNDIFSKSNFSLAIKASVKYRVDKSQRVDKEIFLMLFEYNKVHNILKDIKNLHIFIKNIMAQKDIWYLTYLLDNVDLLDIYNNNLLKEVKINYLYELFKMAGRNNNSEHIKLLFENKAISKIIGNVNSESYNIFIISCLECFSSTGNPKSYVYFHSKIKHIDTLYYKIHFSNAIKNNFYSIVSLILKQNVFSDYFLEKVFLDNFIFHNYKILIKILKHKPSVFINSLSFKKSLNKPNAYGFINEESYSFFEILQSYKIFTIKEILNVFKNSDDYKYKYDKLKQYHLKNSIKTF